MNRTTPIKGLQKPKKNWLKSIGWLGFMFFLVKGLLWIALFYGLIRL